MGRPGKRLRGRAAGTGREAAGPGARCWWWSGGVFVVAVVAGCAEGRAGEAEGKLREGLTARKVVVGSRAAAAGGV